jgi:hypothetical protein
MKLFLILALALGIAAIVPDTADARKKQQRGYYTSDGYSQTYRAKRPRGQNYYGSGYNYYGPSRGSSMDCIVADNLDPAGNYSDYPCWAAKAFAPKRDD